MASSRRQKRLEEIAAEIKSGKSAESYREELDRILGTEVAPSDPERDEAWQREVEAD